MSKVKFELNLPGLNELMKSGAMQSILNEKGAAVAASANGMKQIDEAEYGFDTKTINWIAITTIRANNGAAVADNAQNNTLLKALGGGR
ncbi:MAG: hypothetical protein IIZ78_12735 [Clostridiales bacterium]|jgi:hypothetical protein|nr:hypothetical protein [Clostridiales bacterium]